MAFNLDLPQRRIVLMGLPGSGKSTTGRILSSAFNLSWIDVDEDILEPTWKETVGQRLQTIGEEAFIVDEGETCLNFDIPPKCVLSLSGSSPLFQPFMLKLSADSIIFWLDIQTEDVVKRLPNMQIDRIVSYKQGQNFKDIASYRRQFYEKYYQVRIIITSSDKIHEAADKIKYFLINQKEFLDNNNVVGTRDGINISLEEATIKNIDSKGGLYVPIKLTNFTESELEILSHSYSTYSDLTLIILEKLIPFNCISPQKLKEIMSPILKMEMFARGVPVTKVANFYLLELFHGPTGSFKDYALQLAAPLFSYLLKKQKRQTEGKSAVLVATSGDTGSATAAAFSKTDIPVVICFPENGVSNVQKTLMLPSCSYFKDSDFTILTKNDFDFCQLCVKSVFSNQNDNKNGEINWCAMNSINILRIYTQIIFHFYGYLEFIKTTNCKVGQPINICIPTGNFGNVLSAFYAKQMGLPINKIISATNQNSVLSNFEKTGVLNVNNKRIETTLSPAIDILEPSNLERFVSALFKGNHTLLTEMYSEFKQHKTLNITGNEVLETMQNVLSVGVASNDECLEMMTNIFRDSDYMIDSHTAVAVSVYSQFLKDQKHKNNEKLCLIYSTAHYIKSTDVVTRLLENMDSSCKTIEKPAQHANIENELKENKTPLKNVIKDIDTLTSFEKSLDFIIKTM